MRDSSPVRPVFSEKTNNVLKIKQNPRSNSMNSPQGNMTEGMTAQIDRLRLEADLHLEGGDVKEYINTLMLIYDKVKSDSRYKKLQYELSINFLTHGYVSKAVSILKILYEETAIYDDDNLAKTKKLFQFSLDIANGLFSMGRFKLAFEYYSKATKHLNGVSDLDLSNAQLYCNKGL